MSECCWTDAGSSTPLPPCLAHTQVAAPCARQQRKPSSSTKQCCRLPSYRCTLVNSPQSDIPWQGWQNIHGTAGRLYCQSHEYLQSSLMWHEPFHVKEFSWTHKLLGLREQTDVLNSIKTLQGIRQYTSECHPQGWWQWNSSSRDFRTFFVPVQLGGSTNIFLSKQPTPWLSLLTFPLPLILRLQNSNLSYISHQNSFGAGKI